MSIATLIENTERWHTRPEEKRRPFCVYDENGLRVAFFTSQADARLAALAPALFALAHELLDYERAELDGPNGANADIYGPDIIDWLIQFRIRVREALGDLEIVPPKS